MERVPYMIVVGEKEEQSGSLSVRSREEGDLGGMSMEMFVEKLRRE